MLTTQVENQDPLDPIKTEDYATQLAQFSAVEQQTKTNDLLEVLNAQFGQMGMAELANWVGMEARVEAPASFDGGAIAVAASPVTTAEWRCFGYQACGSLCACNGGAQSRGWHVFSAAWRDRC